MRYEVLKAMKLGIQVLWKVTLLHHLEWFLMFQRIVMPSSTGVRVQEEG